MLYRIYMPAYTYGDYVYKNNKNDAPDEYYIQSILEKKKISI